MQELRQKDLAPFAFALAMAACGVEQGGPLVASSQLPGAPCAADEDCAVFNDANACNGVVVCVEASCEFDASTLVVCDSGADTACLANRCDPADGKCKAENRREGLVCDDGRPCTVGDVCAAGLCTAGSVSTCDCESQSDCEDDADLCNGGVRCALEAFPYRCVPDTTSAVSCPTSPAPCAVTTCVPKSGKCEDVAAIDGAGCDDGEECTANDACEGGACIGGDDTCACKSAADCPDLDGNPCTGTWYCDLEAEPGAGEVAAGQCKPNLATVVTCAADGDTTCRKNLCSPATGTCGLTPVNGTGTCDDDNVCTDGEVCTDGSCVGGKNTCVCTSDTDCADKDDGDLCNGTMYCDGVSGVCKLNAASAVSCATSGDTTCALSVCYPKTGACAATARADVKLVACGQITGDGAKQGGPAKTVCSYRLRQPGEPADADAFPCDDGKKCTAADTCEGKSCKSGAVTCECADNGDCADDGDLCNGVSYCDKAAGKCALLPASKVTCSAADDTACVKNVCAPKAGVCVPTAVTEGTPCTDNDACTTGDSCAATKVGVAKCEPGTFTCACKTDADCLAQDDGDLCNGIAFCNISSGTSKCSFNPASVVFCSDKNDTACLKSKCAPKTGKCAPEPIAGGQPCADGSACTSKTKCSAGKCAGGEVVKCDATSPCSVSVCDVNFGCVASGTKCDDGNACTADMCDPKTGSCSSTPRPPGSACDADGSACTVADGCDGKGGCKPGAPLVCPNKVGPCQLAACVSKSATTHECKVTNKTDGVKCPDAAASCYIGAVCVNGDCKSGGEPILFSKVLPLGLGRLRAVAIDHNGDILTAGSRPAENGKRRWLIARLDTAASPKDPMAAVSPQAGVSVGAILIARQAAKVEGPGAVMVAGTTFDGTNHNATIARFTPFGTLSSKVAIHVKAGYDDVLLGADRAEDGRFAAALLVSKAGKKDLVLAWIDAADKVKIYRTEAISAGRLPVATAVGDLDRMLTLTVEPNSSVSSPSRGLSSVNILTKPVVKSIYQPYRVMTAAVGLSGGRYLITSQLKSPTKAYVQVVDDQGVERVAMSSGLGKGSPSSLAAGVVRKSDGTVTLAGRSGSDGWLMQYTGAGAFIRQRYIDGGATDRLNGITTDALGRIIAVGSTLSGFGEESPWLVRTDPWLAVSCAESGPCMAKTPADCDDGSSCTADACNATKGCFATTLANGSSCDSPTACALTAQCAGDECKPPARGLLHFSGSTHPRNGPNVIGFHQHPATGIVSSVCDEYKFNNETPTAGYYFGTITGVQSNSFSKVPLCPLSDRARRFRRATYNRVALLGDKKQASGRRVGLCRYATNSAYGIVYGNIYNNKVEEAPVPAECASCDMHAVDFRVEANGSFVVVSNMADGPGKVAIAAVTPGEKPRYSVVSTKAATKRTASALLIRKTADATWIGTEGSNWSAQQGYIETRSVTGALLSSAYVKVAGKGVRLAAFAEYVGGGLLVGGDVRDSATSQRRYLAHVDAIGKVVWAAAPPKADNSSFVAVDSLPDGTGVGVYGKIVDGIDAVFLARHAAAATVFDVRLSPGPGQPVVPAPGALRRQRGRELVRRRLVAAKRDLNGCAGRALSGEPVGPR